MFRYPADAWASYLCEKRRWATPCQQGCKLPKLPDWLESCAKWEKSMDEAVRFRDLEGRRVPIQTALDAAFARAHAAAVHTG